MSHEFYTLFRSTIGVSTRELAERIGAKKCKIGLARNIFPELPHTMEIQSFYVDLLQIVSFSFNSQF
jgi:hypothetical protein